MGFEFYITPDEYVAAERNGINGRCLDQRVRRLGWHKERAINTPIRKLNSKIRWGEIAESNGIKYDTFAKRVNSYGWPLEKAVTEPLVKPKGKERKYSKDLLELAEKNGISYLTFLKRISRGMNQYEAATTPLIGRSESGKKGKVTTDKKYGNKRCKHAST